MKACAVLVLAVWVAGAGAAPAKKLVQSCLLTASLPGSVEYQDLAPATFNEEQSGTTIARTFLLRDRKLGLWEGPGSKRFGLVYDGRKIQPREVARLGTHAPATFNPYTAQWGLARSAREKYVCITFNFDGLGESGSFQNIRALYLIDTQSRPARFFYTVGDIGALDRPGR